MIRLLRLGACAWVVGALSGCHDESDKPSPSAGLKVALPKGWVAKEAGQNMLLAGPPDHGVLRLEKQNGGAVPTVAAVDAIFSEQKVIITKKESSSDFLGYQYSMPVAEGGTQTAMLGFRHVGSSVFRCASTPAATTVEVDQAFEACRTME